MEEYSYDQVIVHDRRRTKLPLSLIYNLVMALVDPRSKRLGSVLEPFVVCIYGLGTVAIMPVDGGC